MLEVIEDKDIKGVARIPWVSYRNGNYVVYLNTENGTKIRFTEDDYYDADRPESMDIKITNNCDKGCPWCHEDSKPDGLHADLTQSFIDTIPPYTEIAIGGGNILTHPEVDEFLLHLKEKKLLPSVTVNQTHFLESFDRIKEWYDNNLVYGIGVSLTDPTDELISKLKELPTSIIHVINGILTEDDINKLSGNRLKILVLGYKDIRRGHQYKCSHDEVVLDNISWLSKNMDRLYESFSVVCMDNLALEQLPVRETIGEETFNDIYMGDDGQHTFYIDMVKKEYAVSSTHTDRYPIGDKSVIDMFSHVKSLVGRDDE